MRGVLYTDGELAWKSESADRYSSLLRVYGTLKRLDLLSADSKVWRVNYCSSQSLS